jgi:O-succinylbenzoic acid--CoA ligase
MLDDIEQAIVVPIPDVEWGFRPVGFIKSKTGKLDTDTIVAFLRSQLPHFKIPRAFYEWPIEDMQGIKVSRSYFRNLALKYISDT